MIFCGDPIRKQLKAKKGRRNFFTFKSKTLMLNFLIAVVNVTTKWTQSVEMSALHLTFYLHGIL